MGGMLVHLTKLFQLNLLYSPKW